MYLLKRIFAADFGKAVGVENGILAKWIGEKIFVSNSYWGDAVVELEKYADCSKFEKTNDGNRFLLSYVSSFDSSEWYVANVGDGFKKITFHISTYQPEKIEGYIIFIQTFNNIKTSGEKIFGRYPNEVVALLKEGDYIEFEGRRIEVINSKLVLII